MPIIDLKPALDETFNAQLGTPPWSVVGAGSAVGALADTSNASYLQWNATTNAHIKSDDRLYKFGAVTLATNQRVSTARLRLNFLDFQGGSPQGGAWTFYVYGIVSGGGSGMSTDAAGHYFPSSSATVRGPVFEILIDPRIDRFDPLTTQPRFGFAAKSGNWQHYDTEVDTGIWYSPYYSTLDNAFPYNQTSINNIKLLITQRGTDGNFWYGYNLWQLAEAALELDVRTQPTVTVQSSVGSQLGATVTWQSTMNDGDVQSSWELAVFTQAQAAVAGFNAATSPAVYRVKGTGTAQSAFIPGPLTIAATYVAYVRVGKVMGRPDDSGLPGTPRFISEYQSNWASNSVFVTPVDTATYVPTLPLEGVLGCHDWHATIQVRGGSAIIADLPWTQLQWGRKLQDVSAATVIYPRSGRFISSFSPWQHELAIWRDSEVGPVVEWVGPVVGIEADRDNVTVRARDWFSLLEHRRVRTEFTYNGIELATTFAAVFLDGLGSDNSAKVGIVIHATGTVGDRVILPSQYRRSADILRELGRAGVEWTMVGRTILAGGTEFGIDPLRTLIDEHVSEVSGNASGEAAATSVTVVGRTPSGVQVVEEADAPGDPRGVLETVINTSDVQDAGTALLYALTSLALLQVVPTQWMMVVTERAQSGYGRLVPGARVPVDLPSMGLFDTLRLRSMDVDIRRSPDGQTDERCTLTLTNLGAS